MVKKAKGFVNVDAQVLDLTLWDYSGVHYSKGGVEGEDDVLVFAIKWKAVEEFRFVSAKVEV